MCNTGKTWISPRCTIYYFYSIKIHIHLFVFTRIDPWKKINLAREKKNDPWRKYRIEIHSERIRVIPRNFGICFRTLPSHSQPIRKTFCISFDEKRPKINPNESEIKFLIRINPSSDWFKANFQSESIRMNPRSDK